MTTPPTTDTELLAACQQIIRQWDESNPREVGEETLVVKLARRFVAEQYQWEWQWENETTTREDISHIIRDPKFGVLIVLLKNGDSYHTDQHGCLLGNTKQILIQRKSTAS